MTIENVEKSSEKNLAQLNEKLTTLISEREKLLKENAARLTEAETRIKSAKRRNEHTNDELKALQDIVSSQEKEIQKLGLVVIKSTKDNIDCQKEVDMQFTQKINQTKLESQLSTLSKTVQELTQQQNNREKEMESKLGTLSSRVEELTNDRERELESKLGTLSSRVEELTEQRNDREKQMEKKINALKEECEYYSSCAAKSLQQVEQSKAQIDETKELLKKQVEANKLLVAEVNTAKEMQTEATKQVHDDIKLLESSHGKEIAKIRKRMTQTSQANLKYETSNTHLQTSLQELTAKVDREIKSHSEHIKTLYQELRSIQSQLFYQTSPHSGSTNSSQTQFTRHPSLPIIPTLHEDSPLTTLSSERDIQLPHLHRLPSASVSDLTTKTTPRKRPQSVKVRNIEPPQFHQTVTEESRRLSRRNTFPSITAIDKQS